MGGTEGVDGTGGTASSEDANHAQAPDLDRFVIAQDSGSTYQEALAEIRAGQKRTHWMWFVFPQISGLGHSPTAQRFAIGSLDEAIAYLEHPVLGVRLVESARAILAAVAETGRTVGLIFGPLDGAKLRSSMTLFALAAPDCPEFTEVLDRCYGGDRDPATLRVLGVT